MMAAHIRRNCLRVCRGVWVNEFVWKCSGMGCGCNE